MCGDFPPSSKQVDLRLDAAQACAIALPARTEPVKKTLSMSMWFEMSSPVGTVPLMKLATPGGLRRTRRDRPGGVRRVRGRGGWGMRRSRPRCTAMAPAITKAKLGSQAPARFKNPMTLSASVMPDTPSPRANTTPARKTVARALMGRPRGGGGRRLRWQTPWP